MELTTRDAIVKRAKELGIKNFFHDGVQTNVTVRLNPEIAKSSLLAEIRRIENTTTDDQNDEELPEYAEKANQKIEEIKQYIRDSIREICFAEKANDFDKLYDLLGRVPANIISRIVDLGTTVNTATKYRSSVFADLDREFNNLKDDGFKKRFQYFLDHLRKAVYTSDTMQNLVREKSKEGNARFKERKQNKTVINPSNLIIWAVKTLSNCDSAPKTQWKAITQAIKTLTGRRTSEILSSGKFVPSLIKGCLLFKGQNKRHSEESFRNEKPIVIPVIGGHTDLVLIGITWLEKAGKRIKPIDNTWKEQMDANKKVNQYYGAYLTDFCRGLDGDKLNWYGLIDADSDWKDKQKPDCTRDIYTQIIGVAYYNLIKQELSGTLDFLSAVLGHSDRGKTIIKYDVDFSVRFDDIQSFVKNIDLKSIPVD